MVNSSILIFSKRKKKEKDHVGFCISSFALFIRLIFGYCFVRSARRMMMAKGARSILQVLEGKLFFFSNSFLPSSCTQYYSYICSAIDGVPLKVKPLSHVWFWSAVLYRKRHRNSQIKNVRKREKWNPVKPRFEVNADLFWLFLVAFSCYVFHWKITIRDL